MKWQTCCVLLVEKKYVEIDQNTWFMVKNRIYKDDLEKLD
jgi:uncharacterized membrane protein